MDDGDGDDTRVDVAYLTAILDNTGAAVVTVVLAMLVRTEAGAEILVAETVEVVGPESEFEFHVMGELSITDTRLKFGLFRLPPWAIASARLR